jgi:NitT/TauT family transport system permease protein
MNNLSFFGINNQPKRWLAVILVILPFALSLAAYISFSYVRHLENPDDRLVPTISQLADGFKRSAFEKDQDGDLRLWIDTLASLRRFFISLAILFLGVIVGVHMGTMPYLEMLLYRFVLFFDKIPALALLPILFIIFGLGELSKIALIVIGVMPTIILDTYLRAKAIPQEDIISAKSQGASDFEVIYRVVLRCIFPKVLDNIRLNLKSVIQFLIAGEALAATVGLAYRIYLVRRYIAMDIIIPYVIWMSLLFFLMDWLIRLFIKKHYPWLDKE